MAYRDKGKDNLGAPIRESVTDPEVVDFLRINRLNFQWIDLIGSLEIFANGWLEFILNKGQDRINLGLCQGSGLLPEREDGCPASYPHTIFILFRSVGFRAIGK